VEEAHNLVKVRYPSNEEEYVDDTTLNELISLKKIREVYRPSEGRWVGKTRLAVRRERSLHQGIERRTFNRKILSLKDRTLSGYRGGPAARLPAPGRIDIYC
jgi:hypothetical protein